MQISLSDFKNLKNISKIFGKPTFVAVENKSFQVKKKKKRNANHFCCLSSNTRGKNLYFPFSTAFSDQSFRTQSKTLSEFKILTKFNYLEHNLLKI